MGFLPWTQQQEQSRGVLRSHIITYKCGKNNHGKNKKHLFTWFPDFIFLKMLVPNFVIMYLMN